MTTIKALKESPHFKFAQIPAGTFMMGEANPKNPVAQPLHLVTLKAFEMCAYPVTQGIWIQVMGSGMMEMPTNGPDFPVRSISWSQIQEFISRLNEMDPKHTYRLPTEAEWEYVAKEGHTADGNPDSFAWHYQISDGQIHIVGQKAPNTLGLYDMLGNVWEYCQDIYQDSYIGAAKDGSARETPLNYYLRVQRGGSYMTGYHSMKVTERGYAKLERGWASTGFRLVRTAKAKAIKSPVKPPSAVKGHPHQMTTKAPQETLTKLALEAAEARKYLQENPDAIQATIKYLQETYGKSSDAENHPSTLMEDLQAEVLQKIQFMMQGIRDALPKLTQDIEALLAEIRLWKTDATPIENKDTQGIVVASFDPPRIPVMTLTVGYGSRQLARRAQKKPGNENMQVTRHPTMPSLWALVPRTPKTPTED